MRAHKKAIAAIVILAAIGGGMWVAGIGADEVAALADLAAALARLLGGAN